MVHRHHPAITLNDARLLGQLLLAERGVVRGAVREFLAHQLGGPVAAAAAGAGVHG